MEATSIVVISAGLGVPSSSRLLADQLAAAAERRAREAGLEPLVTVYELRDLAVDIANNVVTGYAAPRLAEAIDAVERADAIIAVSPVFSASYSGLFKSFIDVLDPKSLQGKPVLLGATGGSERHSMVVDVAMRPLFAYLRTRIVPTAVFAAPMDWGRDGAEGANGGLSARIERAAAELAAELAPAPAHAGADEGSGAGAHAGSGERSGEGTRRPALATRPAVATRPEDKSFEDILADLTGSR
ncbi:CE1759 family FMN reductase [Sinomonas mesophila]|uniref:CE1759 family FMN reductase n=1 Tax=Sinomonas mesophila TaxID=1531955 RepID=UPI000984B49F|nr:CE1759 family FMN reductase [Sinomonas mesophila]